MARFKKKRKRIHKPMTNTEMMERAVKLSLMDARIGYDIPPEHYYNIFKERNQEHEN